MRLVSISGGYYASDKGRTVKFVPVGQESEENKAFFSSTPSGSLEFTVSETASKSLGLDQGRIGSEFYIDITPANKAE